MSSVTASLAEALETTPVLPRDAVTVALAGRYAGALDDCFDSLVNGEAAEDQAAHARVVLEIARLGARLEAVLDRLGMSPGARPALNRGEANGRPDPAAGHLGRLQDAAAGSAAGQHPGAALDPAVAEALADE